MGCGGMGRDQVGNCFCLREIEFSVQERAEGKLACVGKARTLFHQQMKYLLLDILRTVTGYFYNMFSCIGSGCFKKCNHHIINHNVVMYNLSVMNGMCFEFGKVGWR